MASNDLPVFVSILPQQFIVEQIGGKLVTVDVLVEPGQSPATYEPTPRQLERLNSARIYFSIGVPFENSWLAAIERLNPDLNIIAMNDGIQKRITNADSHDGHNHQGGLDPHVWNSPPFARKMAKTVFAALSHALPEHVLRFEHNYEQLDKDLASLHDELTQQLLPVRGKTLMSFHPAWGYFAQTYGLKQIVIEASGKSPTARQLTGMIKAAKDADVKIILVQQQFSRHLAERIASIVGAKVILADPLAKDYIANLRSVSTAIIKGVNLP